MQYVLIVLAIIFYIVRFILKQKKEQEEAERRRQQIPSNIPPVTLSPDSTADAAPYQEPQPKTIDEILREMHRRVETRNKPYAKPVEARQIIQKPEIKKEYVKPIRKALEKKEPAPFLTAENAAYEIEVQRNMREDFIRQGELTDIHNQQKKSSGLKNFNVRDAVIGQIILQRPEW
ncbi:MAG: hypothetical protein ABIQ74_05570 [Chitinophagales bacterium]